MEWWIEPIAERFESGCSADLVERLRQLEAQTLYTPLISPEQLCLRLDGTTCQGSLRYLGTTFRYLCRSLSKSLHEVWEDLVVVDPEAAVAIFNRVVRTLFPRLRRRYLVRDVAQGWLVGLVGSTHSRCSNREFWESVSAWWQQQRRLDGYCWQQAILQGRDLILWYRTREPLLRWHGLDYFGAFYLTHGEAAQRDTRGVEALWRSDGSKVIGVFREDVRLFQRRTFRQILPRLLQEVLRPVWTSVRLLRSLERLEGEILEWSVDSDQEARERLWLWLTHLRPLRAFFRERFTGVVFQALAYEQRRYHSPPGRLRMSSIYESLLVEHGFSQWRELQALSQAAYLILDGQYRLPRGLGGSS